jgi:MYXO-CTERM domain-containing protein
MKLNTLIAVLVVLSVSVARGAIIDWSLQADGDGAIVTDSATFTPSTDANYLNVDAAQLLSPGHLSGSFTTDTETDPTVWVVETVENQTNFTWTDYHIEIGMDKNFSIVGVISPQDWTWLITPPIPGQPLPCESGTGWVGTVDYYAGPPIAPGESGQFGFVVSFDGSVFFCTEQVPTPEPAAGGLLAVAALFLRRGRR